MLYLRELLFIFGKLKNLVALFVVLALLLLLGVQKANGEPLNAASFIGMCSPRFPCSQALKSLPRGVYNIGYLHTTFGDQCGCLKRFERRSQQKGYVRVHAVNGTCFPSRGRQCAKGEFFYKESVPSASRKLNKRDLKFLRLYRKHLRQTDEQVANVGANRISICLECPLPNSARRVMLTVAKRTLAHRQPSEFVDSPVGYSCLNSAICERHGVAPSFRSANCISDNDGAELKKDNLKRYLQQTSKCESRFYWTRSFNLLSKETKEFITPLERTHRTQEWEFRRLRRFLKYSSL